jgi:hypothetical protein
MNPKPKSKLFVPETPFNNIMPEERIESTPNTPVNRTLKILPFNFELTPLGGKNRDLENTESSEYSVSLISLSS